MNHADRRDRVRPHIVRRPRLTALLDATNARIILLCGPAGYGKTTLAREWIEDRGKANAWYEADNAAADPAALAQALSDAAAHLNREHAGTVRDRLGATGAPPPDVPSLGVLLAGEFGHFPGEAWVVIDDYHLVLECREADELVARLVEATRVRFLIASRKRPEWLTTRFVLYGDAVVIDQGLLAMTPAEAREVLAGTRVPSEDVVAMAAGWPAVIGLAALAGRPVPRGLLPAAIHDYIAEELLATIPSAYRRDVYLLGLLPSVDRDAVEAYAGNTTADVICCALRSGFLTPSGRKESHFDVHPLIRSFLLDKLHELAPTELDAAVAAVTAHLLERGLWDQAFELVARFPSADLFSALLEHAIAPVVDEGRVATLDRWLDASAPYSELSVYAVGAAQAKLMRGAYTEALALSLKASETLDLTNPLLSRAYRIAGTSAHMLDDEKYALALHTRARQTARSERDRRDAIWGQVVAAAEISDAAAYLDDFISVTEQTADDELAVASVRMLLDTRAGRIGAALGDAWNLRGLLSATRDPMIRTGFLNMLSNCLSLAARYADAGRLAEDELSEAIRFDLGFIEPYALCNRALAAWGTRDFDRCDQLVEQTLQRQQQQDCPDYLTVNVALLRARSLLAAGNAAGALDALEHGGQSSTGVLQAEHLCMRAIALAAIGHSHQADELARTAEAVSTSVEIRVLVPAARAIMALRNTKERRIEQVSNMLRQARESGNLDAVVLAYRTCPSILEVLPRDHAHLAWLTRLVRSCNDQALLDPASSTRSSARSNESRPLKALTRRENEILEMVTRGFTNNEISQRLFISEVTVKAHLRSVYRKLGVRTRTQAAVRFLG